MVSHPRGKLRARLSAFLSRRAAAVGLVGVLAAATALRLWGLGRESLWLDEATSLRLARLPIPTLVRWTAADIHPPLYYLMLHFWRGLGESEATLRGLSVIGGVVGVGLAYLVGRELFDGWVGLASGLLLAASPLHIWYSQEARGYTWLAAFSLLATFGLARLLCAIPSPPGGRGQGEGGKPQGGMTRACLEPPAGPEPAGGLRLAWLAYVAGAVLALYVHYYALFVILAANVLVLGLVAARRAWRFLVPWGLAQVAVVVLYLPWLPIFLKPILSGGQGWVGMVGSPAVSALPATVVSFMVGDAQRWLSVAVRRGTYLAYLAAMALGVGRGARRAGRERRGVLLAGLLFALPIATVWLVSQVKPIYAWRYLLPFLPPFLILAGRGATVFGRPWQRLVAVAVLLVGPAWATAEQVQHLEKPDWRNLAEEIAAEAKPGDVVVLMPSWHGKPLGYYLRERVAIGGYVPEPLDGTGAAAAVAEVDKIVAPYKRVWLVWEKGHYTDPTGVVAAHLDRRGRRLQTRQVPGLGELLLYELAPPGA